MYARLKNPLERVMSTFKYKFSIILVIAAALAVSPFCRAFSTCQTLGQFCGNPPSDMFPKCCPFDTDLEGNQIQLKCKNVENEIGSCESVKYHNSSSSGDESSAEDPGEDPK